MTTRYTTAPASIDAPDAFHQGVVGAFFGRDLRKVHIRVGWLAAWEERCARSHHMSWKRFPADPVLAPGVELPQEGTQKGQEAASTVEAGQGQGQRLKSAKNAPITAHAKKDMEAAPYSAIQQRAALDLEIQQLEAALGRVSG